MSEGSPYQAAGGLQLPCRKSLFVSAEQLWFSGGVVRATAGQLHACQRAPEMQRESSNSINQFNIQQ